jgi:prepilin-type N-terminal cleavage/methylation domain-containing protein
VKVVLKKQRGFSLVEMSVVIVIVAVIAGSVLGGSALIEQAKLQAVISETGQYRIAFNSFSAKYDQFPGDFNGAVALWGATTANGNNNGQIEFKNSSNIYEEYRAWQHLAYAKMVDAPYLGTATTSVTTVDVDVPKSKISGGGYFIGYGVFSLAEINSLVLGSPVATSASPILVNGVLTQLQAQEIDAKIDDGAPSSGSVRGKDGNGSAAQACVVDPGSNGVTSDDYYKLSVNTKDCTMAFRMMQ